ncbi:MAG: PilT/PilU family type 4a pilus ATPase [Gemmatimonadetes bacterium]|nr:PilT/PilU family type 4a pilus ATPase [Gemmatimonadota bacterium]
MPAIFRVASTGAVMGGQRHGGANRAGRLWVGSPRGSETDIHTVLSAARAAKASDVHIMAGTPIYLRVDGALKPLSEEVLSASTARHLSCALLNERQVATLDEQLDFDFMCADSDQHRYRINVGYSNGSVGAVIRLLPSAPLPLEDLKLPRIVEEMTRRGKGLILVTGSTSQGKTTTMASIVDAINRHSRKHIVTIEDPIEYLHTNKKSLVRQREVGRDTRSFEAGLRAALRQDPDVLVIGEMRDYDTIEIALRAAETGVLVLSTLHIISVEKMMDRLLAYAAPDQAGSIRTMTAEVLQCVIHQELLPTVDGGKRIACEVLVGTRAVRNMLRTGSDLHLRSAILSGRESGMVTMQASLEQLRAQKLITDGVRQDVLQNYGSLT